MSQCLFNDNYLNMVVVNMDLKEILNLSRSNKVINEKLSPDNNNYVNTLFYIKTIQSFFDFDKSVLKNKKILLAKNIHFQINWKYYLNQLHIVFEKYKDEKIKTKIKNSFMIHIYLPDIRKEIFILEFPNSTMHQTKCYDYSINLIHTYNFYSKYFTPEFVLDPNNDKGKIVILRERLIFEDHLINFKNLFGDYINNKEYIDFINNVFKYEFEILDKIYLNQDDIGNYFKTNEQNNNIIKFILFVNHLFIMYATINCEYLIGLLENQETEEHELFNEYVSKKNDLINCALLINSNFENVNIIVNLLVVYKEIFESYEKKYLNGQNTTNNNKQEFHLDKKDSDQYKSKIIFSEKFTLYKLFLKIINQYYTERLTSIRQKFKTIAKNYCEKVFHPKQEQDVNEIKMEIEEENIKDEEELKKIRKEKIEKKRKKVKSSEKYLLENFLNSELDNYVDEKNILGIMHSNFKVSNDYKLYYENVLVETLEQELNNCVKDGIPLHQLFDTVEKMTRCEGNSKNVYANKESLNIIRRTKIKLMKTGFRFIFNQFLNELLKDYVSRIKFDEEKKQKYIYLSPIEKVNSKVYEINMDVLSREGQENVENNVKIESERVIEYIITSLNIKEEERYLPIEYVNLVQINYVYFLNELMWNFYLQIEIYEERNFKIEDFIKNGKNKRFYEPIFEKGIEKEDKVQDDREKKLIGMN